MLLSALILALLSSLTSAVLSPLSAVGDENECALYLSGPGRTSSYDYSLNLLRGNFGYEGQHTCITYDAVNRAYLEARKRILVSQPKGDWTPEDYASVGELVLDISTNLARTYGLSYEEIEKGLPLIDTSRTLIREVCPPVFSHVECRAGKYRRLDGLCNNLEHPTWGAINAPFQRLIGPLFADGINSPRVGHSGRDLPLSRVVSRTMHPDDGLHDHAGTVMVIAWGQFMDHDYTLTGTPLDPRNRNDPEECCKRPSHQKHPYCNEIRIPDDDYFYKLFGVKCIDFVRAFPSPRPGCRLGSRIPFNTLTGVIDGNTVYGVTEKFGRKLRTGYGGLLRMNPIFKEYGLKDLLPLKLDIPDEGCTRPNKNMFCFEAGEIRVNEQLVLTVMHTLMAREHNRVAIGLTSVNPHWDDETLYQEARRIVIAEIQHINYNEFLPILLGKDVMEKFGLVVEKEGYWDGYDPHVNPDVIASFAAAAYRFGHSLLPTAVERWSKAHKFIASKRLSELIRRPYDLYRAGVLDEYVMGLMNQVAQAMDDSITQEVTNHLFKKVGARFGMDLVSFNMQRGREFGLPGYMEFRKFCGLPWTDDFQGLFGSMPNETVRKYEKIFEHPVDVDLWSGGVSERPLPGSMLGPTFACIIATQFSYSRRGDRFWYELPSQPSSFTPEQLQEVRKSRLARIICDNTDIIDTVQLYPMVLPDHELNPRIPCKSGILPSIDFSKWAETPPFSGAAKQFMTRAFVPDRQITTVFTENNGTEIPTTETKNQTEDIKTTESLQQNQIVTTDGPEKSSSITSILATITTTTTNTPNFIPSEDINQILDILKYTTAEDYLKEPLTSENTIIKTTTAEVNCTLINCTISKNGNNTPETHNGYTVENYESNTDLPEITTNVSANNTTNNVERHKRSDSNINKVLKAPLLFNYEVPHNQIEKEELLPPGVVKGSADFNIETFHDEPEKTTENIIQTRPNQLSYHAQNNNYKSQPKSKLIEQKSHKNYNPVNVKFKNHDGKFSHEYTVSHDPKGINDYLTKQKDYVKNKSPSSSVKVSYHPHKHRHPSSEYSSEKDDSNQKKYSKKYETSREFSDKKKSLNYSLNKHKMYKSNRKDDHDDGEEEILNEKSSKENNKESHSNNEDLENDGKEISGSEEDDKEKPLRDLSVENNNTKVRNYDRAESDEMTFDKFSSESEESEENIKNKPLTKEKSSNNNDEITRNRTGSHDIITNRKENKYRSPPRLLQKAKYEADRHGLYRKVNETPHYYVNRHAEDKLMANYEFRDSERPLPYGKGESNSYDGEKQIHKVNQDGKQQKRIHFPYIKSYKKVEEESDKKSNYEKRRKYNKPYINKNVKNIPQAGNKNPNDGQYKNNRNGRTKQYKEIIVKEGSDEDDRSDRSVDFSVRGNTDGSRLNQNYHRTRPYDTTEDDSREHDGNTEDTSENKSHFKNIKKVNYRQRHKDTSKSVEDESVSDSESEESGDENGKENYRQRNKDTGKSVEDESVSDSESEESGEENDSTEQKSKVNEKYRHLPIKNERYDSHHERNKKLNNRYSGNNKKPNKIQEDDFSDFSHERIQLNNKGEVEAITDSDVNSEEYEENKSKENKEQENNHKYISDDSNEYNIEKNQKLKNNRNSEELKKYNSNDSGEYQSHHHNKIKHQKPDKYKKKYLDDSINYKDNSKENFKVNNNKKPQRYQQFSPEISAYGQKIRTNVGEVKPVVELGHESISSSEEIESDDKSVSEDESLEDFLRKDKSPKKDDDSYTDIRPARIKLGPNVKQQVERIPLNYKHDKINEAKNNEEQRNPLKETPVNDDDPDITLAKVPEKAVRYDQNLNFKFDDVQVKLPEINLPEDILDFNYEESFYKPNDKKSAKIYIKEDVEEKDPEEEENEGAENEDEVSHLHHHENDHESEPKEESRDDDHSYDHENYDYTSSPYRKNEKEKDVHEEFDFTKSPFEQQQEPKKERKEEDLYEKFVRERFGKRQQTEQKFDRIHKHRILPNNPVLYHNIKKILDKTKKTMKEAELSDDPNAGYAWTIEYAEPLVEI